MNETQRKIFLAGLGLVVILLLARPYLVGDARQEVIPVTDRLQAAYQSGKPLALVFSYGAECCPSTEGFFAAYDMELQLALAKHKQVEAVWLNVGAASAADQEAILLLTRQYGVTQVPSLLILDREKQKFMLLEGQFDAKEAENALREVTSL